MSENVLDIDEFMNRVQNDKELFLELLDIFVQDFLVKRKELEEAINSNDSEMIEHIAHFLKGSCGNISAKSLRSIIVDLEEKSKKFELIDTAKCLSDIDEKFEELAVRIGEVRKEL